MTTGYPYETIPIDTEHKEIRVLSFAVGRISGEAALECSFRKISLSSEPIPEYYAVSYTWGSADVCKEIFLDGHKVSVPQNTEEALRRLRRHGEPSQTDSDVKAEIVLWIDAICIDQTNPKERSQQVAMMGLVYSSAAEVLIWLGPGGDGAEKCIAVVKKVTEHCRSETNDLEDVGSYFWRRDESGWGHRRYGDIFQNAAEAGSKCGQRGNRLPLADVEIESLQDLFSAPWFTRLWAVQEVILAKQATSYYGEHSMPAIDTLIAGLWLQYGYRFFSNLVWNNMRGADCAASIFVIATLRHLLTNILLSSRRFECLDLRDKVYAILGLLTTEARKKAGQHAEIEPNYEKSLNEVWRNTTRAAVLSNSSIEPLRFAGTDLFPAEARAKTGVFQSWVLNYQRTGQRSFFEPGYDYSWYIGEIDIDGQCLDPNVLAIKGTLLDEVAGMGKAYTGDGFPAEIKRHIYYELDWIRRLLGSCFASKFGESMEKAICTILACGMTADRTLAQCDIKFQKSAASFMEFWKDGTSFVLENGSTEVTDDEIPFLEAFYNYSRRRIFFITESGKIGMGPGTLQEGDVVVQLFGNEVPFVLRKEGEFWTLIGDAYFHDLPDHIRQLQESGRYPDPRYFYIK